MHKRSSPWRYRTSDFGPCPQHGATTKSCFVPSRAPLRPHDVHIQLCYCGLFVPDGTLYDANVRCGRFKENPGSVLITVVLKMIELLQDFARFALPVDSYIVHVARADWLLLVFTRAISCTLLCYVFVVQRAALC